MDRDSGEDLMDPELRFTMNFIGHESCLGFHLRGALLAWVLEAKTEASTIIVDAYRWCTGDLEEREVFAKTWLTQLRTPRVPS